MCPPCSRRGGSCPPCRPWPRPPRPSGGRRRRPAPACAPRCPCPSRPAALSGVSRAPRSRACGSLASPSSGVVGGGDHGVDHPEVVLLHGVGVLDVVGELLAQLVVGHASYLLTRVGSFPAPALPSCLADTKDFVPTGDLHKLGFKSPP